MCSKCILALSPCVAVKEYRGSVRRTRGLTLTVKNFMLSFSHPLLRNYRFFGLFPILFTQLPAIPLDTAREKKYFRYKQPNEMMFFNPSLCHCVPLPLYFANKNTGKEI